MALVAGYMERIIMEKMSKLQETTRMQVGERGREGGKSKVRDGVVSKQDMCLHEVGVTGLTCTHVHV